MPKHYPPEQKTAALDLLKSTGGDVAFVHAHTTIPERTLYAWRRSLWLQQTMQQHTHEILSQIDRLSPQPEDETKPALPPVEIPEFKNDLDALKFLRGQIVSELVTITVGFRSDLRVTSPYQRAAVLAQLLDRLMKLDKHIQPYLRDAQRRKNWNW